MRDVQKLPWSQISLPGRNSKSCQNEYNRNGFARLRDQTPSAVPHASELPRCGRPPVAPSPVIDRKIPPACRTDYLDALRERAELQLRIAERGLTAGFFGDPPPGRSALDERRAAASLPTLASSHVEPTSSPRDDRDLPGHARFPTFAQVIT